jgi:hypothetical protein
MALKPCPGRNGIDGRQIVDPGFISSRTEAALLIVLLLSLIIGGAVWLSLSDDSLPVVDKDVIDYSKVPPPHPGR